MKGDTAGKPALFAHPTISLARKAAFTLFLMSACAFGLDFTCRVLEPDDALRQEALLFQLPPKAPGSFRVLAYGESTTWGAPVPELGFVSQLSFFLQRLSVGRRVEVFNLGRIGCDSEFVRDAVVATLGSEPDLLVVLCGHNEFLRPELESSLRTKAVARLRRIAVARTLLRILRRVRRPELDRAQVFPDRLTGVDRHSAIFRAKIDRYKRNLTSLLDQAEAHDLPVALCTAPSNLADWLPAHQRFDRPEGEGSYQERIDHIERLIAAGQRSDAREQIDRLERAHPEDAMVPFLLGRLGLLEGADADVRRRFVLAKDEDPIPWRALSETNEFLRAQASRRGVFLVDAEEVFAEHAPHRVPGFDLMADNCHPTPAGSFLLAEAILRGMAERRLLFSDSLALEGPGLSLDTFLDSFQGSATHGALRVRFLLETGKYCMKVPFFDYRTAEARFREALEIEPGNWELWANLGTISLFLGRTEQGRAELRKAALLKGSALDPADRLHTPYLMEALAMPGVAGAVR